MRFIYLETYGCSANQNNTEIMMGMIRQAGLQSTNNPEIADAIIINSCIVKGPTENKIKHRILELKKLKKPIIIAGCMSKLRKDWLEKEGCYLLGIKNIKKINNLLKDIEKRKPVGEKFLKEEKETKLCMPKISLKKKIGITQISEGCLGNCTYCLTRLAKGALFSYPEEKIIENVRRDIESGCKEIWLTSQDSAAYGKDQGHSGLASDLAGLLKKIVKIEGNFKVRIGMMNPNNVLPILDKLIDIWKDEKVYKFLHIPIQSGSNKILKSMGRKYEKEDFLRIVERFREEIPEICLATDIIVGFPGETQEDFEESLALLRKTRPDVLNTSRFWPMKGTRAALMPQLDRKTINNRAKTLHELHLKISKENNEKFLGREIKVFVNEYDKQLMQYRARFGNYLLVLLRSEKNLLGKNLKVKIKKVFPHYLVAE